MVIPQWTAPPWYTLLAKIILGKPLLLPQGEKIIYRPFNRDKRHPFGKNLNMMWCRLLGRPSKIKEFHSRLMHEFILSSWRHGTHKKISNLLEQMPRLYLRTICQTLSVKKDLDFLLKLYEQGLGDSGINAARCALSSLITLEGNMTIWKHLLVHRFIKVVF